MSTAPDSGAEPPTDPCTLPAVPEPAVIPAVGAKPGGGPKSKAKPKKGKQRKTYSKKTPRDILGNSGIKFLKSRGAKPRDIREFARYSKAERGRIIKLMTDGVEVEGMVQRKTYAEAVAIERGVTAVDRTAELTNASRALHKLGPALTAAVIVDTFNEAEIKLIIAGLPAG